MSQPDVVEAALALDAKLAAIHADPAYQCVWSLHQVHHGPYDGPKYEKELSDLRKALLALPSGPHVVVPVELLTRAMDFIEHRYFCIALQGQYSCSCGLWNLQTDIQEASAILTAQMPQGER